MDNLSELQRRKAELKGRLEQQRIELKKTFLEVREEIEPSTLLKKAVGGLFGSFKNKEKGDQSGILDQLPAPVAFIADLFIKDPKWRLLIKLIAPTAIKLFPKLAPGKIAASTDDPNAETPVKAKIYGNLRQSIVALRGRLRKKSKEPVPEIAAENDASPSTH
jgi:hypothetical protein